MALLEFRSRAAGGFFMMPETFKGICEVLGREYSESGCWLSEDLDEIIEKIETHVKHEKAQLEQVKKRSRERDLAGSGAFMTFAEEDEERRAQEKVSFAMRVFPLLDMLRAARDREEKVWWGVP